MDFLSGLTFDGRVVYRPVDGYIVVGSAADDLCRLSDFCVESFCYESSFPLITVKLSKTFSFLPEERLSLTALKDVASFWKFELVEFQFEYCPLRNALLNVSCSIEPGRYFSDLYLGHDFIFNIGSSLTSNDGIATK